MTARASLRAMVDAKCKACVYDPKGRGTWRDQVANCCGVSCPLYPARPLPKAMQRNDAISDDI